MKFRIEQPGREPFELERVEVVERPQGRHRPWYPADPENWKPNAEMERPHRGQKVWFPVCVHFAVRVDVEQPPEYVVSYGPQSSCRSTMLPLRPLKSAALKRYRVFAIGSAVANGKLFRLENAQRVAQALRDGLVLDDKEQVHIEDEHGVRYYADKQELFNAIAKVLWRDFTGNIWPGDVTMKLMEMGCEWRNKALERAGDLASEAENMPEGEEAMAKLREALSLTFLALTQR